MILTYDDDNQADLIRLDFDVSLLFDRELTVTTVRNNNDVVILWGLSVRDRKGHDADKVFGLLRLGRTDHLFQLGMFRFVSVPFLSPASAGLSSHLL
jgi:hypothetical protein